MKPMSAQGIKFTAVAGGIWAVPANTTGTLNDRTTSDTIKEINNQTTHLMYLKKLVGHLLLISHPASGAKAPIRKK
jgi:hypothetical protein